MDLRHGSQIRPMWFRRIYQIAGLHPHDVKLLSVPVGPAGVGDDCVVYWTRLDDRERGDFPGADSLLQCELKREFTGKPGAGLLDLAHRRWPQGVGVPSDAKDSLGDDGTLIPGNAFFAGALPSHLASAIDDAATIVESELNRALRLLVWRSGAVPGRPWVSLRHPFEISENKEEWVPIFTRRRRLVVDGLSVAVSTGDGLSAFVREQLRYRQCARRA